ALCTAPPSDCVPQSTCTTTACARPLTWAKPWAQDKATISVGQVRIRGIVRPLARASAMASTSAGWSLPKLAKRWVTPASVSASSSAVLALYIAEAQRRASSFETAASRPPQDEEQRGWPPPPLILRRPEGPSRRMRSAQRARLEARRTKHHQPTCSAI